jgi:hypothetical protein
MKTSLKILGLTAVFLLILEGIGQCLIRVFEARTPSGIEAENIMNYREPLVGFGLKKNAHESMSGWKVETNRYGFRTTENFPIEKPKNEIRIFVVGGSTVFGWGVNASDSIPRRLQAQVEKEFTRDLSLQGKRVRILNAGVPWYSSWHEATLVFSRLLDFNPDQILVLDGLNDTAAALAPFWSPIVEGYIDVPSTAAYQKRKAAGTLLTSLLTLAELSPTFRYFNARRAAKAQMDSGVPHPEVWIQYVHYMRRVKRLAEAQGTEVAFFFQPVLPVAKTLTPFEVEHNGTSMKLPRFADHFRTLYLQGEKTLGETRDLNVKSLSKIFGAVPETIYLDGLHYNAKGNTLLAEALFEEAVQPTLTAKLGLKRSVDLSTVEN